MARRRTGGKNGRKKLPNARDRSGPRQRAREHAVRGHRRQRMIAEAAIDREVRRVFTHLNRRFAGPKKERTRNVRPSERGPDRSDPVNRNRTPVKKIQRYMRIIRSTRHPSHGIVKKRLSHFNIRYLAKKAWKEQVCSQRKARRETLFKSGKAGKGKTIKTKAIKTAKSFVRC